MVEVQDVLVAFGLTLFAGLSTGIGSALAFFAKRHNRIWLSVALGFSAGVMLYVSFVEIFFRARESLERELGQVLSYWLTVVSFFGGIMLMGIIDWLVPSFENPHSIHRVSEMDEPARGQEFRNLYRMGLFTALAVAVHNFPEGFATFASALKDLKLGIPIAIAIAIHNIPEGIAVSVPIYYSTGNRRKAFAYSFLSGLSEPLGALVGYLVLRSFIDDVVFGIVFALVAGIMVYVSLDELLPAAREYGKPHLAIRGLVAGMAVTALGLLLSQ
jgi:ZIP family zinc transporter